MLIIVLKFSLLTKMSTTSNGLLFFVVLVWIPFNSCIENNYLNKINHYLNASSVDEKSKYMADDFHSFFMNKDGKGKTKTEALQSFQNWDGPMHPDISIINYSSREKNIWTVTFNEQNDFSKPIGFPGWKGTTTFVFNAQGLIEETLYVPDSTNLSYKPFLQPALEWLQKNMPAELKEVYKDNRLVQTEAAANKWRILLQSWRSAINKYLFFKCAMLS